MKVFISYSVNDYELVAQIKDGIGDNAEVKYWDKDKELGEEAWKNIFKWIDDADVVLVVITGSVIARGLAVGQEIGHAKKSNKKIIPLVAEGISCSDLGCLGGITYEVINNDIGKTLRGIKDTLSKLKTKKEQESMVAILGIVTLVLLVLFGTKN